MAAAAPTAEDWASAFEAERQGALRGLTGPITPAAVVEELRRARAAEAQLTQQLAALQSRAAALQLSDSASRGENLQLRQALHAARAAAEPSVVQLRQLLLDPGVNREFSALRAELEARSRELAAAQLQLAALQVRPDPLLVKLDRQQEEIAELRRQVGESRAQQLERALAAAREQLAELRASHRDLEQHCHLLDQQAEQLAEQLLLGKRGNAPRPPPPRRP